MRRTLNYYDKKYNPDFFILKFGDHIVYINTNASGSAALFRALASTPFDFIEWQEAGKNLILQR